MNQIIKIKKLIKNMKKNKKLNNSQRKIRKKKYLVFINKNK